MEEQFHADEGISLIDIIRVLFNKIKLLILVVVIGAAVGVGFAFWRTHNVKYYGTTVEFYVNPEKPKETTSSSTLTQNAVGSQYGVYGAYGRHVMDAIVKLLSSESFAEKLMLSENGLPDTSIYPNISGTEYDEAFLAIEAANKAWEAATVLDTPWMEKMNALNDAWTAAGLSGSFSLSSYNKYLQSIDTPTQKEQALINAYEDMMNIDEKRDAAIAKAEKLQAIADDETEDVFEEWRLSTQYKNDLKKYKEAVSYAYLGDEEELEDVNNLARSFIYVKINVLNDKTFAETLLNCVRTKVPEYVEQNMIVPTDYEGTSCTRITRTDEIEWTNPNYTRNEAIKFGVIAAALAGVIAAVAVIIIDRLDKRLRDYEIIPKNFNVPVLGIVPTIEDMLEKNEPKKKNTEAKK